MHKRAKIFICFVSLKKFKYFGPRFEVIHLTFLSKLRNSTGTVCVPGDHCKPVTASKMDTKFQLPGLLLNNRWLPHLCSDASFLG